MAGTTKINRRTVLKTAVAGSAGAVAPLGLDGCAHAPPGGTANDNLLGSIDAADVDRYLKRIDRRMAWIDKQNGVGLVAPPAQDCAPEEQAAADRLSRLFRKSTRSLYLTGCFLEAPEEIRTHPGMQARMYAAQGDMDEAVFGTTALLESLTTEQHRQIRVTLQERPEVVEKLARYLDSPAKQDGLPLKRRYLLRAGLLDLAGRMKAQAPGLVIDPYVRKVRKIEARGAAASSDAARLLAARIGEEAFWAHQERMAKLAAAWERKLAQADGAQVAPAAGAVAAPVPAPAPSAALAPAPAPAPTRAPAPSAAPSPGSSPPVRTSGQKTLTTGAYIMGFGLGSVLIGGIFAGLAGVTGVEAFTGAAVVMGVTVGPILLAIGLLVVLVGAIMSATDAPARSSPPSSHP